MKKKITILTISVIIPLLCVTFFYGCSKTLNESQPTNESAEVVFKLTIVNPPGTVSTIVGLLERSGYNPIQETFVISGDTAIGDFGQIVAGTWHLSVTAYDSNQTAIYFGETDVTVRASQLNIVNLHMNPLTGELIVVVTWGGTINPTDSMLVAYYPLTGNVDDMSGNGYHGTVSGATTTYDRFNNASSAYFFNGVSDYIVLPTDFDFQERTISIWFKASSIDYVHRRLYNSDHPDLDFSSTNIDIYMDSATNDKILRLEAGGGMAQDILFPISLNEWYYAVITVSPNYTKAYINGNYINSVPFINHHSNSGYPFAFIGANRDLIQYFFHGVIDDIRIYNHVLSLNEILTLYHENGW